MVSVVRNTAYRKEEEWLAFLSCEEADRFVEREEEKEEWNDNDYSLEGTERLAEENNKHVKKRPEKVSEEWQAPKRVRC